MRLLIIGERLRYEVTGPTSVGRHPSSAVQLMSMKVSREHASVSPAGPGLVRIEDLGSRNGTFVNGKRVTVAVARSGDEIAMGDYRLLVEGPPPPEEDDEDDPAPGEDAPARSA